MAGRKKRKIAKPADRATRERIVILRDAGMSWSKLSAEMDMPSSTVLGIYQRETGPAVAVVEEEVDSAPLEARVLKPFPNPRLICIYFGDRKDERFAKCVVRPRVSWTQHQKVMVLPVEGDDELYRLERDFVGA